MKRSFIGLVVAVCSAFGATAKYPFPFVAEYPYGVRATEPSKPDVKIQKTYDEWVTKYYSECPDGQRARIKWVDTKEPRAGCSADGSCTVSEGIGYGMLILVYMDNPTNNTQAKFDKLFKYYNSYLDGKGVMKWIIDACNAPKDDGGATDAELDVALSLLMAYKQWGSESYLTAAKGLIGKIWDSEVDQGQKILKSGSQWTDAVYNPSYFATSTLRLFQEVDPIHDWKGVADKSLELIKKNQNSSTGLVSDWCNSSGGTVDRNGSGTGKFGYDAARTPWRVTLDYLWFGTPAAKSITAPVVAWIRKTTGEGFAGVAAEYSQSGATTADWSNILYMGAFATPGLTDATNQDWVNDGALLIASKPGENYYNTSWKILYQLTLSGNFQNLWTNPVGVSKGRDGRRVPEGWKVSSRGQQVVVQVPGATSASVELLDAEGKVHAVSRGASPLILSRPTENGVYFAVVRSGDQQVALPVVGN